MLLALGEMVQLGCKFIVGGRKVKVIKKATDTHTHRERETQTMDNQQKSDEKIDIHTHTHTHTHKEEETEEEYFLTLEKVFEEVESEGEKVPDMIKEMFWGLSEEEFRLDLSSTEIRNRMKK